jgi:Cu/Ag efflux pump CusA
MPRYALDLESVKGVSEVASVGGFVKQYQVDLDPNALVAYNLSVKLKTSRARFRRATMTLVAKRQRLQQQNISDLLQIGASASSACT